MLSERPGVSPSYFIRGTTADVQVVAIPDPLTRRETIAWIRSEFERNRHAHDMVYSFLLHVSSTK